MEVKDNYTDKSFVVYGETKKYKDSLKALGGKFNKNLTINDATVMGWVFGKKALEKVFEFVQKANAGEVNTGLPSVDSSSNGLPTVTVPSSSNNTFQFVKFKIYKPSQGQTVKLKFDGQTLLGKIVKLETHNDIVDTVYVDFDGKTSLLQIINGNWRLNGLNVPHSVFFEN